MGRKEVNALYRAAKEKPDSVREILHTEGYEFVEIRKEVAPGIGIAFRGVIEEDGTFSKDYYFPYREAEHISSKEEMEIYRLSDKEGYLGICDDLKLGVDLVFFIQDIDINFYNSNIKKIQSFEGVVLSALADEGAVLLPLQKKVKRNRKSGRNSKKRRRRLLEDARNGNQQAYEELTLSDMEIYSDVSKRVEKEDVYSIVESTFMPDGLENDKFAVVGEILSVDIKTNKYTKQNIYELTLRCNDLVFEVCINEFDLLGEPSVGRRFKGRIWMQGKVKYSEKK